MADWKKKESFGNEEGESKAPFNMALATLERIHEILTSYQRASLKRFDGYGKPLYNQIQYLKTKQDIANGLLLASWSLLSEEQRGAVDTKFKEIVVVFEPNEISRKGETGYYGCEDFNKVNTQLDNFVKFVIGITSKKGIFMPDADDEGMF